jgi:hypothetical protein
MNKMKPLAVVLVGVAIAISGSSAAFAKGHDAGAADGNRLDPSILRGGIVASHDVPGVGVNDQGVFLGVADSLNSDMNYGRNVVQDQVLNDTRRVIPVVNGQR